MGNFQSLSTTATYELCEGRSNWLAIPLTIYILRYSDLGEWMHIADDAQFFRQPKLEDSNRLSAKSTGGMRTLPVDWTEDLREISVGDPIHSP